MGNLLDGESKVATEEHCSLPWNGTPGGERFRCYLCGHRFVVGDKWRFVLANGTGKGMGNFLVCEPCDGPDVLDRWDTHCEEGQMKFFWMGGRS